MKSYEKLFAFSFVLLAICWMAWMTKGEVTFVMVDGKPVSVANGGALRDILVGLVGVLGMAGQSLFRVSETASAMNDLLQSAVDKLGNSTPSGTGNGDSAVPQKVEVANKPSKPVPTTKGKAGEEKGG